MLLKIFLIARFLCVYCWCCSVFII